MIPKGLGCIYFVLLFQGFLGNSSSLLCLPPGSGRFGMRWWCLGLEGCLLCLWGGRAGRGWGGGTAFPIPTVGVSRDGHGNYPAKSWKPALSKAPQLEGRNIPPAHSFAFPERALPKSCSKWLPTGFAALPRGYQCSEQCCIYLLPSPVCRKRGKSRPGAGVCSSLHV